MFSELRCARRYDNICADGRSEKEVRMKKRRRGKERIRPRRPGERERFIFQV